ncbi:hypothetical protein FGG08_003722 [Glutinoglossum americanum]|uniref:Uncharacterized protein n=1 Tax=Glutinoglossum americanum TaxID=1670608 RepID=A0A9P8KXT9_9PEZI|nr:hypothetical protein FGG08_003722 [Glutinoglossum americanum]
MATIGSTLVAVIRMIDVCVKFIGRVRDVPQEVEELLDDISHYSSTLDVLQKVLDHYTQTFNFEHDGLNNAIVKFHCTIIELEKFIEKHAPLTNVNTFIWVVDDEYKQTIKKLKDDTKKYEDRITMLSQQLQLYSSSMTHRAVTEVQNGISERRQPGSVGVADGSIDWRNPFGEQVPDLGRRAGDCPSPIARNDTSTTLVAPSIFSTITRHSSTTTFQSILGTMPTPSVRRPSFTPKNGAAKIWCKSEQATRVISKIRFREHKDGRLLLLQVMCVDGVEKHHKLPDNPIPYQEHRRESHKIRNLDPSITNLVKFFGSTDYEYRFDDEDAPLSGVPNVQTHNDLIDCKSFQETVVGKTCIYRVEVDKIYSKRSSKTAECNWQNLQLWENRVNGGQSITFFGNGKEQRFLEFKIVHLRPSKSQSKGTLTLEFDQRKAGKTRTPEEALEKSLSYLKITFTDPGEIPAFLRAARFGS